MSARLAWIVQRVAATALIVGVAVTLGIAGWHACGRYGERCEAAGQLFPGYDRDSRRINLVMHDLNKNGVIDTWVYRNERGIEEVEIDRNEDGVIDRVLVPDGEGTMRSAATKPSR
jgi:hypothetical protein